MALEPTIREVLAGLSPAPAQDDASAPDRRSHARDVLSSWWQEESASPWFVRGLLGFSGWVAACFLAFAAGVFFALTGFLESGGAMIVIGGFITWGALWLRRSSESDFACQLALAAGLAGEALVIIGFGMVFGMPNGAAVATLFLEGALLVAFPDRAHRFLSTVSASSALLYLLHALGGWIAVELGFLALTLVTHVLLVEAPRLRRAAYDSITTPATLGLACTLLGLLTLRVVFGLEPELVRDASGPTPLMTIGVAALSAWSFWRILLENRIEPLSRAGALVALGLTIGAGLTLAAPGVLCAAGLMALAFHRRHAVLLGLSVVFLLGFAAFYYYDLTLSLRAKSIVLMGTGVVLFAVRALALRGRGSSRRRARDRFSAGIVFGGLAVVLLVPAAMVIDKERLLASGQEVLLELAPVDPRSLMQGDYMVLDYEVSQAAQRALRQQRRTGGDGLPGDYKGLLVLRLDEEGVGHFLRVHAGEPLGPRELLLRYRRQHGQTRIQLGAESYFFQEGHAQIYEAARYGELKVAKDGSSVVLVGLRDKDRRRLRAD